MIAKKWVKCHVFVLHGNQREIRGSMKKFVLFITIAALSMSCNQNGGQKNVVSQRYIHKYGYDVSPSEWETKKCPGQVLTTFTDGKTIVETFEDGILHGQRTETFPHSQTLRLSEQYERGTLVKRVTYSIRGVPQREEAFKSPTHIIATEWYAFGSPKSREEIQENVILSGEYFNLSNEVESRIQNGTGLRTVHNPSGDILAKEVYNNYECTYIETFYPNNMPKSTASYERGNLQGEKKKFAMTGEPISVEQYVQGKRHGVCTYYQNGCKYLEVPYAYGIRHGIEREYIDGQVLAAESEYQNGERHGTTVVYVDGSAHTSWYYHNDKVTKEMFDDLSRRIEVITRNS
ncbi:MAG: hypothetical protein A3F09_00590 [Chlamydiae bacterium RIFCSPHIGHO2_12_FULL_49_11]|nr:MAG: hypothetical protein A3F09_00590 [Chlamydiae bacterium RIFCSPHIGHO2_12_FULL_49_11]